jgi:TonB family protein
MVLRVSVDKDGAVEHETAVVQSVPPVDEAAAEALRQWRFKPDRDADKRPSGS